MTSARAQRALWALIAAGVAGRLLVAFATHGSGFDIESYALVAAMLHDDPLALYRQLTPEDAIGIRWPYPPGYLPWLLAADAVAARTPLPFHATVALAPIAADAAIAWLVQDHLGRRGASDRVRLVAASLVAAGPSFAVISGWHSQHDSVAILPAVLAFSYWDRSPSARRALVCGLLLGTGAAIKTVPGLLVLALLPSCRTRREAAVLLAATVAVPLLTVLPWLAADPEALSRALRYVGAPSAGGITLLLQPERAGVWLGRDIPPSALLSFVIDNRVLVNLALACGLVALVARARPPAVTGAVLLVLGIYSFGTGFFFQYLVWGLPFLLMAGHLRAVAAIQAVALVPTVLIYKAPAEGDAPVVIYVTLMVILWLGFVTAFFVLARRAMAAAGSSG